MSSPVYFDSHMHTPLCKHARGEPEEYAETAIKRGFKGIIFTCHCPMPDDFWPRVRMDMNQLSDYVAMVYRARDAFEGTLEVRLGIESEYYPGTESWIKELHERQEFHHCLGSVHYFSPEYQEAYWKGDLADFQAQYFDHLAASAETGLYDTLSHPDIVKNIEPKVWDFDALYDIIASALDRIAATGTAMELNTSGLRKAYPETNPGPAMLKLMSERGIPVVIGSDSHTPERVGWDFATALDQLEAAGYSNVSYFTLRQRQEVPIPIVRAALKETPLDW
jgi:HisJ family histidinol phosphate phosphatase